jgi:hypothetical protein
MTQWEYCTIGPLGFGLRPYATKQENVTIKYIRSNGVDESTFIEKEKDLSRLVARLIAFLGKEGWEMVGTGTVIASYNVGTALTSGGNPAHILYFKRPVTPPSNAPEVGSTTTDIK